MLGQSPQIKTKKQEQKGTKRQGGSHSTLSTALGGEAAAGGSPPTGTVGLDPITASEPNSFSSKHGGTSVDEDFASTSLWLEE